MNVAGLLETIRILKDKQFNNNIYILFTDGEESSYLGAYSFIENNNIKFDLVINFDNAGSSGNMMLYHYSNDFLTKQYFKSVNNESSYSFINDLLYNPNSRFYQGSTSDAFAFIENGYNTIDIALSCNAQNYHGEEDNFYNIDVNALSETTKNMIDMFSYYGDNGEINTNDEKLINFQLFKGFEISLKQKTYIIISMLIIAINFIYIVMLFDKKEKIVKRVVMLILTMLALGTLFIFKNFSLLLSIPVLIMFITDNIKNEKSKFISKTVLFEMYFFIVIQLLVLLIEYLIWIITRG